MKVRVKKPFNERVPIHLNRHLAFSCSECYSWLYYTRDLVESRIDLVTGVQYRKFICADCGEVHEFTGRRGIKFPKVGKERPAVKRVKKVLSPEMKVLIDLKKQLEKIVRGR